MITFYHIVYLITLFLSLATSTGAIMLTRRLTVAYQKPLFESLFYYVTLVAIFGFYGIWGQVLIVTILSFLDISSDIVTSIAHITPLLGFPFLMVGGYMLIRAGYQLTDKNIHNSIPLMYFIIYLLLLCGLGWISFRHLQTDLWFLKTPIWILISFYLIQDVITTCWFSMKVVFFLNKNKGLRFQSPGIRFVAVILLLLMSKIAMVIVLSIEFKWNPLFILFYFIGFSVPILYMYMNVDRILYELQPGRNEGSDWNRLLIKEGITRREREVTDLICQGKSNQEIADILFISLQTVKDHTHRIYLKIGVKNRIQLISKYQNTGVE